MKRTRPTAATGRTRYAQQMRASTATAPARPEPGPDEPPARGRFPARPKRFNDVDSAAAIKLRELRLARGLSQGAVAAAIGLTFQQVQKYENGANRMSAGHLYLIARLFGVSTDAFFGDVEAPPTAIATPTGGRAYPRVVRLYAALGPADRFVILRLMVRLLPNGRGRVRLDELAPDEAPDEIQIG